MVIFPHTKKLKIKKNSEGLLGAQEKKDSVWNLTGRISLFTIV